MHSYTIWIESDHAKVFKIDEAGNASHVVHRHEIKHHTSSDDKNHHNLEKFFHTVAESIKDAAEILLVGPGLAKDHFKSHLEHHHHASLAKKVVGVKAMDHVSDAKILEFSREFFKQYDLLGQQVPN